MLILCMSSPAFLLPLPWIPTALTSRQFLGKSGNFSKSTLTFSPLMGFQPLLQSMVCSRTPPPSLDLKSLPRPAAWTRTRWPHPKLSFSRWKKHGSSAIPHLHGPVLSTWFLNLMVPGGPVGIYTTLTLPSCWTDTLFPLSLISPPESSSGSKFFSKLDLQKGYF